MNKKKRRLAVVLSAVTGSAVLVLSGCSGKSEQTEKTLRVGVITYSQDDPFINGLTEELKVQLKAMENKQRRIIVSTKSGNDDQQEQNEKVEEMIDAGCDVLCINLVDRTAPSRIVRMARNEDIPVIFFNREPVREDLMQWEKLYYVGCDAEQSGIMQGEIAAEYINSHPEVDKNEDGKIQYVLLEGEAGHQDAISRTEYSVKTLMKNDVILEKLSYQLADWNRGQAENLSLIHISVCNNLYDISISYEGAREAVSYRVLYGTKRAINIAEIVPKESKKAVPLEETRMQELFRAIHVGNQEKIRKEAIKETEKLHKNAATISQYNLATMEIVSGFFKFCANNSMDFNEISGNVQNLYERVTQFDENSMTNWIINMSTAISEKLRSTRNSTSRRIITDAQNIVKDRYMEPDLSLDDVCADLGVSNSYFSSSFKKETGQSFVSYLTDYRK